MRWSRRGKRWKADLAAVLRSRLVLDVEKYEVSSTKTMSVLINLSMVSTSVDWTHKKVEEPW